MNIVQFIFVVVCVHYTSCQFYPLKKTNSKSPCDSGTKVALVEQFFNIIFTEFQVTPPVCVCVQMCVGQSTYCYPNGCLKRDANVKRVDSPQSTHTRNPKSFMFIVDEKSDTAKKTPEPHVEDPNATTPSKEAMRDFMIEMRPDVFKNKYSMLVKHKKTPNIKLKYNLREQVKYMKADQIKTESLEFSKTRWPQNKPYGRRHNTRSAPSVGKTNVFMSMLPASHYAEYTPKYSKRDISSTQNIDDPIAKAFYLYDNSVNNTDNAVETPISLETLIDNLIRNSITTKYSENNNTEPNIDDENQTENKTVNIETTTLNGTVDIITLNLTDGTTDKNNNTYDISTTTNKINEIIKNFSKRIEIQNNTSLELVKRITTDFDEERLEFNNKPNMIAYESNTAKMDETEISPYNEIDTTTAAATLRDNMATKKNRQRRVRNSKLAKIYH